MIPMAAAMIVAMKRTPTLAVCAAGLCLVAGCNSVSFFLPVVPTANAQYRAYGDSITYGYALDDPLAESYPALVAEFEHVTFANNANPGDEACDVSTRQIFPNGDSPTLASHPVYTVLIGTNDVDRYDAVTYEPIFTLCHQAVISWLGLPAEYKVLAGDKGVSATGEGALDTANQWHAWTTLGQGSSVRFTIITARDGPIYAWTLIDDSSDAAFTYSLDGIEAGSEESHVKPDLATQNGSTVSLGFLRIAAVPAGTHVVAFVQTSAGSSGVSVVGIGSPAVAVHGDIPTVLAGTVPRQYRPTNIGHCWPNEPVCLSYIKAIEDNVTMFAGDGLNVRVFDTWKYMHATSSEMHDSLHPNALGEEELSHAVEAAW